MTNELLEFLSKHVSLSDELKETIIKISKIREYKKGTFLLKEGELANECFLVLKGCMRSYLIKDGEEKTLEFYSEEELVMPLSYGNNEPSTHYLECIEDTIANVSTSEYEQKMFREFPQFETICRIMGEVMMANYQDKLTNYKIYNPEERYLILVEKRSDLVQRVPQYQIASYLGLTPQSLSRIRRRILSKSK